MKVTDGKTTLKSGLPNMRQALFYAYNDPACQAAAELHIVPEIKASPKGGSGGGLGNGDDTANTSGGEKG
jgi:hypothetical protein